MRPSTPVQSSGFVKTTGVLNDAPDAVGDQPMAPLARYQEVIFFRRPYKQDIGLCPTPIGPLGREHISLDGDCAWPAEPLIGHCRPSRIQAHLSSKRRSGGSRDNSAMPPVDSPKGRSALPVLCRLLAV